MSQRDDLTDQIAMMEASRRAEWRQLARVTPNAAKRYAEMEAAASNAKQAARSAAATAERYKNDDTLYPEGRDRLAREAVEKGRREAREQIATMRINATIIRKEAELALLPPVDPAREMAARDELRLLVDSAPDPLAAFQEAVGRNRELASVACSSYGESLLRARGVRHAAGAHEGVKAAAAHVSLSSEDPQTRLAASAYARADDLDAIASAVHSYVNDNLGIEA